MPSRDITIAILTWNGIDYTRRCLDSLRRETTQPPFRLVLVDNGSTDGTLEYLRGLPDVTVIANATNLGFVAGNNQAIAAAGSSGDIVLMNNDIEIPAGQGAWLEHLQHAAYASDDIGVVGCRLRRPSGMLQHAGAYMPLATFWGQQYGSEEKDINQYPFTRDVESVVFACVYIKRAVLDAIGPLCTDYFAYFEDTDYCLRARKAGFRTVCCGEVTLVHHENVSTRENKVSHSTMFKQSQSTFRKQWARDLEARYTDQLVWLSTVSRPHGYGMTSKDLLLELDRQNVAVTYRYLYGRGTVFPVEEPDNTEIYQVNVMKQRSMPAAAPHVVYGQGDAFAASHSPYRIGYTMLEVSGLPAEWVRQANAMNEIWVPTEFNRQTFTSSGVKRPIHVMPLGVDTNYFNPKIARYPVCDAFKFLTVFEWGERKAPEVLLKAFNDTFSADEPVVLLCKANCTDPGIDVPSLIRGLNLSPSGGRIEFILSKYVPHYQLGSLYRSVDCFVLASRGEGWGMPILEAMACGLPVISTFWSAPTAFMTEENSYPLQVKRMVDAVAKCPYYKGFQWADPDPDHLRHLLRHVFEHQDEAQRKGTRAVEDVAAKWTVGHAVEGIRARMAQIAGERAGKPVGRPTPAPRRAAPRIAIDVSRAIGEQISGVGRYTLNLVEGLARYGGDAFSYLLLPGFGTFVHPEFGRQFNFDVPIAPHMTLYRGTLPAFSSRKTVVPDVDVLHSTAFMTPPVGDQPLVYTVHDLSFLTHPMYHTTENIEFCTSNIQRAIKRNTTFIAVSAHTRSDMVRLLGIDRERIQVVPNTYDAGQFHQYPADAVARVRAKHRLPERYLLFLASLEPRKNLRTALDAMRSADIGCPLVVAGAKGWLNSPLNEQIRQCGDHVHMLGYVSQEDLGPLYAGARALVYPSLYEGFGLPVLEAMACGTPVVTSRISSLPDVAGDAGILLDNPTDATALADALQRIVHDDSLHARLATAAVPQAATFSQERCTAQLVHLYRSILEM